MFGQKDRADLFRQMHFDDEILVLSGIWDVMSAKIAENAGFAAIALASAPVSWAHGLRDGENLSREQLVAVAKQVCRSVSIPVSCDIEKGYGESLDDVADTVSMIIDAGAIGINIEDSLAGGGLRDIADMQLRIEAARNAAVKAGVDIVINARADAYLLGGSGDEVFKDTINRCKAWFASGADCVFIIGEFDAAMIEVLVNEVRGPLNLLVMDENTLSVDQLQKLGVARISTGPRLLQAMAGYLGEVMTSVKKHRDFRFMNGTASFHEINGLFSKP